MPLWSQDSQDVPQADLNAINLRVPFWHDAVKILLPSDVRVSDMQVIDEEQSFQSDMALVAPGDKVLIVGYPYGYSAYGANQPTPVVLTRFIAGIQIDGRRQELLLESTGAPGMSGGPVFVERDSNLFLLGLYTGVIYPDHVIERNEKVTALGTCSNMVICWGHMPLVPCTIEG